MFHSIFSSEHFVGLVGGKGAGCHADVLCPSYSVGLVLLLQKADWCLQGMRLTGILQRNNLVDQWMH